MSLDCLGDEIGSTCKVPLQVGKSRPRENTGLGLALWFVKGLTDRLWAFGCLVDFLIKTKPKEPVALKGAVITRNQILATKHKFGK